MIGLKRGIVELAPYTYEWKEEYNKEEKLLYSVIGKYVLDIQHVGSTSIEGLDAKPIIDIAVAVESLDKVECFRKNHIYFRDYLRLHKEYIYQYLDLKRDLAEKFEDDRCSYTNEKDKFISMILEKAKEEFS